MPFMPPGTTFSPRYSRTAEKYSSASSLSRATPPRTAHRFARLGVDAALAGAWIDCRIEVGLLDAHRARQVHEKRRRRDRAALHLAALVLCDLARQPRGASIAVFHDFADVLTGAEPAFAVAPLCEAMTFVSCKTW